MAKDKKGSKSAVAPKPAATKSVDTVKSGRVSKPVESAKKTAKDIARKVEKSSKKSKKEPTPSDSEDSEDDTSDSSASSEDDSEVEADAKPKTNGAVNRAHKKDDSSSGSDEDSDDSESDEEVKPAKTNGVSKVNGKAAKDDSDSDDSSEGSDDEDEPAPKTNGHAKAAAEADDSASDDSSDSESDEDVKAGADSDSDSSDASDSEEEIKTDAPVNKKRKAEETLAATPKKTKVTVNGEEKEVSANLFIGNLSFSIDEEWLTREFEDFGTIKSVRVITDRDSGRSKGFGYVEFEETAHGLAAFEAKNGAEVDGRNIRVDFSLPRPERGAGQTPQQRSNERAQRYGDTPKEPAPTLFVGNLSFEADENAVTEVFEEYGTIKGVRLITDRETGDFKGFGYVEMGSVEEAKAAFESLQGANVAGRPIRLDYSTPRPQNENGGGRGGFGGRGDGRGGFDRGGRGGFDRGGRGGGRGRGGFNDRGRGGRGGGRGGSFNRGGFGDFSGRKTTF